MKNTVLLEASYDNRFYEIPLNKPFFTPKERGPIKKRVAPSDSSKNFGLGGMSPKFFYRYFIACKIGTTSCRPSNIEKIVIFGFFSIFALAS